MRYADHLGNTFDSKAEMCRYYGVKITTFDDRKRKGWSLRQCLMGKCFYDHLGNEFKSIEEMCKHYGISEGTFINRIKSGWNMEAALTTPHVQRCSSSKMATIGTGDNVRTTYMDHKGIIYDSVDDMCAAYGIDVARYQKRLKCRFTLEEALTCPVGDEDRIIESHRFIKPCEQRYESRAREYDDYARFNNQVTRRIHSVGVITGHKL